MIFPVNAHQVNLHLEPTQQLNVGPRVRDRRGAAIVEFAAVASVFFMMLMAFFEFGRGLMVIQLMNNVARLGCRQAITGNYTSAQITKTVQDNLTALGVQNETATVLVQDSSGTSLTSSTPSGSEITVKITVPAASASWVPGIAFLNVTLTGQYTMRKE